MPLSSFQKPMGRLAAAACVTALLGLLAVAGSPETPLARIWMSYSTVRSLEADFQDMKAHGVGLVSVEAKNVDEAKQILSVARDLKMQLVIGAGDVTENGRSFREKGYHLPDALMIGGVYRGQAIDRHLFRFAAGPHKIVVEPPVYNRRFAYTLGSRATGRQVKGDPIGHYYPDMPDPVRAEVIVPLKKFDGRQHLRILPAEIVRAPEGTELERDSVAADWPASNEIARRKLYQLRFDLTGLDGALLDQVGIAVYWPYHGTNQYWIFGRGTVAAASPETRRAVDALVQDQLSLWRTAAGGLFPSDVIRAFRYGDECFYITGGVGVDSDAVNYPLWDYSAPAVSQFRTQAGGLEYPRTWGYPEIYGQGAYAWWLYLLHRDAAALLDTARATLRREAPGVLLMRNFSRFGVFHLGNDHDGSGPELLTKASDLVQIDPYPVNANGYQPVIPRDMSYYAGLARRHGKMLVPWMQAHTYGGPDGLQDVTPEQVALMVAEQRHQGVDALMWLGYGKTFPLTSPKSWAEAGRQHAALLSHPPAKPKAELAVLRPYSRWALSSVAGGKVRNPADWMLQQLLEVWAVEEGRAYDVFELPPDMTGQQRERLCAELKRYRFVVGTAAHPGAWVLGEGTDSQQIEPGRAGEFRQFYRRELVNRGWLRGQQSPAQ